MQLQLLCRAMYHGFTTAAGRVTIGCMSCPCFVHFFFSEQAFPRRVLAALLANARPGEEYADIFPVLLQNPTQGGENSVMVARLLNGWPRVAAVAARAVLPWLQARWVIIEAKVRCTQASPIYNFDVGNRILFVRIEHNQSNFFCAKIHCLQAAAALRFPRDRAARKFAVQCAEVFVWLNQRQRCGAFYKQRFLRPPLPNVARQYYCRFLC